MAEDGNAKTQGITDIDTPTRDLVKRGLRARVPKPNIVRIEVLDGDARTRYLGGISRIADRMIRQKVYDEVKAKEYSVFYGFLKNGGSQSFKLTANWDKNSGSGGPLGMIGTLARTAGGDLIGGAMDTAEGLADIAHDLTGISGSFTGTATIKKFNGNDIEGFSIECGWYLPEQLNLCKTSLEILTRMAYPEQVNQNELVNVAQSLVDITTNAVENREAKQASSANPNEPPGQDGATFGSTISGALVGGAQGVVSVGANALNGINAILGRNLTIDPLPVRVSLGHYMDVEPMIIRSIGTSFSKEQFISASGRYLPIFCTVTIELGFWCLPAPRLEFFQLLGKEMFGQNIPTPEKVETQTPPPQPTSHNIVGIGGGGAGGTVDADGTMHIVRY